MQAEEAPCCSVRGFAGLLYGYGIYLLHVLVLREMLGNRRPGDPLTGRASHPLARGRRALPAPERSIPYRASATTVVACGTAAIVAGASPAEKL